MPLSPPPFDLQEPGTYLYDGAASTRGYALNRFALSLRDSTARESFLRDEAAYIDRFQIAAEVQVLIRQRDWSGLLRAGGHLQAILKLAATVGQNLYDIGAHNTGVDRSTLHDSCPRRVRGLGDLGG